MLLPDFLASWTASACGTFIMHPVDTLRVRYQTRGHTPMYTLRNERLLALYSGIVTPVTVGGPINALVFMSNDAIKLGAYRLMLRWGLMQTTTEESTSLGLTSSTDLNGPKLPMWAVAASGGAAGGIGTLIACPAATIRVQQQVRAISAHLVGGNNTSGLPSGSPKPVNLVPVHVVVRDLLATEGIRGLYRAVSLECATNVLGRSTYFGLYEGFKRVFGGLYLSASAAGTNTCTTAEDAEMLIPVRIAAASVASVISWWSIYPLDLLKNKLQAEPHIRSKRLYGNGGVLECARITYKSGGWKAFYVGFPITAIRGSCTGMINLPLYDSLKPIFRKHMTEGPPSDGGSPKPPSKEDEVMEATVVGEK